MREIDACDNLLRAAPTVISMHWFFVGPISRLIFKQPVKVLLPQQIFRTLTKGPYTIIFLLFFIKILIYPLQGPLLPNDTRTPAWRTPMQKKKKTFFETTH